MLQITHEYTKQLLGMDSIENKVHIFYNTDIDAVDVHTICGDIDEKSYYKAEQMKSLILVLSDNFAVTKQDEKLDVETRFLPMYITYGELVDRVCEKSNLTHKLIAVIVSSVWASPKELEDIHARYDIPVLAFLECPENQL